MATINAINNITPTLYGSSIANGDITIEGTSNATKTTSYVLLQPNGGNVGIGVSTPAAILDIATASGASYIKKTNGTVTAYTGIDGLATYITGTSTAHDWRVITNNSERLRITSAGVATFNNKVEVKGSSYGTTSIGFTQTGGTEMTVGQSISGGIDYFLILSGSTDLFSISKTAFVTIGGATPAASAKLDIQGTDGALLVPRMTTTQRDALTAANGMIIYNTTTNTMQGRINNAWVNM